MASEVGNVFDLGTKYSGRLNSLTVKWQEAVSYHEGATGLGFLAPWGDCRKVNDEQGILWPASIALLVSTWPVSILMMRR